MTINTEATDRKIRSLVIAGENNHDWKRSTPFVEDLLEALDDFFVDRTETPSPTLENPDIGDKYDLFFLDYNGSPWSEEARENFAAAVREGTGVTALHAANNAFYGWETYEEMLGLLWRDEADHGEYHELTVSIEDWDHPVRAGFDDFDLWDELYHGLTNPQDVSYDVLATAYSDPDTGGTGQDEPVVPTRECGAGRIFHSILGHVWSLQTMRTFENKQFQKLLVRGSEWAATGEVTAHDA
jgi:type 1 glutamine amidotransferase